MKTQMRWRALLFALSTALVTSAHAAPVIGVAPMGTDVTKEADTKKWEAWLGQPAGFVTVFLAQDGWDSFLSSAGYASNAWKNSNPNRRLMVSVPLTMPGTPLSAVAAGNYDRYYQQVAAIYASQHPNAMIRIGWEFNGGWYAWTTANGQSRNYALAFRRVQSIFEAANPGFKFVWCTANGTNAAAPDAAYPGDDVVDIIGTDQYDNHYGSDTPQSRWSYDVNTAYGLQWLVNFARAHGKPLAMPEWGSGQSGDNPYFVTQMLTFLSANDFAYQAYWNSNSAYKARLTDGQYPQESAAYKAFFAKAPTPTPTPAPTPVPTPAPTPAPPKALTIQAEAYIKGGEGVGYHTGHRDYGNVHPRSDSMDLTTVTGASGQVIGWTANGQWFAYSVNVPTTGSYRLTIRQLAKWAGQVHVEIDGVNVTKTMNFKVSSSITNSAPSPAFTLKAGSHKLVLKFDKASGQNIDSMTLTPQ